MEHPRPRREWKAIVLLGLVALGLILWSVGLVVREQDRDAAILPPVRRLPPAAAQVTADLLARIAPRGGSGGFPRWRELARLGPPEELLSGELGFEALRLVFQRTDGSIAWRVGVLIDTSDEAAPAVALRVECRPLDEAGRGEARALVARWPERVEPLAGRDEPRDGWLVRWRDPLRAAALEARTRAVLGGHFPVDVPGALRDDYELLLDPLRGVVFEPSGGDPARAGAGRRALDRILAEGREDLVRNVLRGLDPEGRTFAMEALLERVRPSPQDVAAMRTLLALDVPVRAANARAGRVRACDALGLVAVPVEAAATRE
jgi:hypothetical protein